MAGNSQKFARIKLGIKLISDSVNYDCPNEVFISPLVIQLCLEKSKES